MASSIKLTVEQVAFNLGFHTRAFIDKKTGKEDTKRVVLKMPFEKEGGVMRVAMLRKLAGITTPVKTGGSNTIMVVTRALLEKKILEMRVEMRR